MRRLVTKIVSSTWKPFLQAYLRKPRRYRYGGIRIVVQPGVFHPGFFFSTRVMLGFLSSLELENKKLLELGSGSGIVSIFCTKQGAVVTASDISATAVANTKANAEMNAVPLSVFHSDLFETIPLQQFDHIVINPPYYKKDPVTEPDYAWYCGEQLDYFAGLFKKAGPYMSRDAVLYMVLSDETDIPAITALAHRNGFGAQQEHSQRTGWQSHLIYSFHKKG